MKRFLSAGLLALTIFFFIFSAIKTADLYYYSELRISENEFQSLTESREETGRDLLNAVSFNNFPLFYDEAESRWFYSVNRDDPISDPTVGFSPAEQNIRIAFAGEIAAGASVRMVAYTKTEYREYTLIITTLPLIRIDCDDPDYPQGDFSRDAVPIRFTLFDNRPENTRPITVSDGEIHMRGGSSGSFDKKGFRLHLTVSEAGKEEHENRTSLLDLRNDGDWLLYAAYNDQEKVRNVFSSNLWLRSCGMNNDLGLENGFEYRYAELFFNRRYWGLYALGYPPDARQMNISPDNYGHYDEFLFKQQHYGPHTTGADPNYDGLILQFDADGSDLNNGISITKMYFYMMEQGAPDGLWHNDPRNAVDIWLFVKLIQAADTVSRSGKMKNMIYTVKLTDRGRIILFTPWDMDITWGNLFRSFYTNSTIPYALDPENNDYEMIQNPVHWMHENGDPEINRQIRERYAELREGAWSETAIDEMLDGLEQDIFLSGAYIRDMTRWPDGTYQDPAAALSLFREYVHQRLQSMDAYIDEL